MRTPQNIIRLLTLFCFFFVLYGCPPRICDPETITFLPLPDSVLASVPYANNQTVKFKHSAGSVIAFTCTRETKRESWGCSDSYEEPVYETDITELKTDYPINSFVLRLHSYHEEDATLEVSFGSGSFMLPLNYEGFSPVDSISINGNLFFQVYQVKTNNEHYGYGTSQELFADSLYYSFEKGIIKIIMTNEEYYGLYQE